MQCWGGLSDERMMKMLLNGGADGNAALRTTARNEATGTMIEAMREYGITMTEPSQSKRSGPFEFAGDDT
jgi:vacuolar-type H+-ATPase subunit C/Vma6